MGTPSTNAPRRPISKRKAFLVGAIFALGWAFLGPWVWSPPSPGTPDSVAPTPKRQTAFASRPKAGTSDNQSEDIQANDSDSRVPLDLGEDSHPQVDSGGSVEFIFVDPDTEQPVPDLQYVVYSEHTNSVHAQGRTDVNGSATAAGLPFSKTIIVETARTEAYTHTIDAVWLVDSETVRRTVRLARGGRVIGRVIDAGGAPRVGATVRLLDAKPGFLNRSISGPIVAVSDQDGKFQVDRVTSRGASIWVIGEEPKPQRFVSCRLHVESDQHAATFEAALASDEVYDLGDVSLGTRNFASGIVVEPDGTPAANVLISFDGARERVLRGDLDRDLDHDRRELLFSPADPGFALRPYEEVTDRHGRFSVEIPKSACSARIVAPDGRTCRENLPFVLLIGLPPDAAARAAAPPEWQITLPDTWPVDFRFVHNDRPVEIKNQHQRALVHARDLETGRRHLCALIPLGSYRYRATFDLPPEQIASIRIAIPGYLPLFDDFEPSSLEDALARTEDRVLTYPLDLGPRLKFKVDLHAGEGTIPFRHLIRACLCPPESRSTCCGLGSRAEFRGLPDAPVVLSVRSTRPYWIKINAYDSLDHGVNEYQLGPFEPRDEPYPLVVSPIESEPPELPSFPDHSADEIVPEDVLGYVEFEVHHEIAHRSVLAWPEPWIRYHRDLERLTENRIRVRMWGVPARTRIRLSAAEHVDAIVPVDFRSKREVALQPVRLRALPSSTLRFLDQRQRPLIGRKVSLVQPKSGRTSQAVTDETGLATCYATGSEDALAVIEMNDLYTYRTWIPAPKRPGSERGASNLSGPDLDETQVEDSGIHVITVLDPIDVEFDVIGVPPDLYEASLFLVVTPADRVDDPFGLESISTGRLTPDYEAPRFHCRLAPGQYRVTSRSALIEFDTTIRVGPSSPVQFTIQAQLR